MGYRFARRTIVALVFIGFAFAQGGIRTIPNIDAFTDANRSRVLVMADQQSAVGRTNAIIWRCDGDANYDLYIDTDEFLTTSGTVPMQFRFDTEPSYSARWNPSTDGTAVFVPIERLRRQFTTRAVAADRVIVGITDFRGTQYQYTFGLTGLSDHLRALGCVGSDLEYPTIYVQLPLPDAYQRVKEAVDGLPYTEDLNAIYFEQITLRFSTRGDGTVLSFEGSNAAIHERIRSAFD